MRAVGLRDPLPKPPFESYSFAAIEMALLDMQRPDYSGISHRAPVVKKTRTSHGSSSQKHLCYLSEQIKSIIDAQRSKMTGLSLQTCLQMDQKK